MLSRRSVVAGMVGIPAFGAPSVGRAADRRAAALSAIEHWMAQRRIPGLAVAMVEEGRTTLVRALGVRSTETRDPLTPTSLVRVGSVSKAFAAITLLRLVDAKRLDLDKPLAHYVPEFRVDGRITARQALSHSGGLTDAVAGRPDQGTDALRDYVAAMMPAWRQFEPGSVFSYSNPGYAPAALAVERVGGRPFGEQAQDALSELQLSGTFDLGRVLVRPHTVPHERAGAEWAPMKRDPALEFLHDAAPGMMWMSAQDGASWMAWLINGPGPNGVISSAAYKELLRPVLGVAPFRTRYALGLQHEDRGGVDVIGHGGSVWGHAAYYETAPSRGCGVALFANSTEVTGRVKLVQDVMQLLGGVPVDTPEPQPSRADQVGRFEHRAPAGTRTIEITKNGDALIMKAQSGTLTPLQGYRADAFGLEDGPRIAFIRNDSGELNGLTSGGRHFARV